MSVEKEKKGLEARLRAVLAKVPHWLLTILCLAAILYLTLSPEPLGDEDISLFPGFDKLAHGIMFFGLTLCMEIDLTRLEGWRRLTLPQVSLLVVIGMGVGIGVEYLQKVMELGRALEFWDMAADGFGAVIAGALWMIVGVGELRHQNRELRT